MPLLQIFRKDKRYWTHEEIEQVELFFILTPFFRPYYEHEDFDMVTGFTFYAKIWPQQQLLLTSNKKSDVIILLSGQIELYRPVLGKQLKKRKKHHQQIIQQNFIKAGQYISRSEVIEVRSDAIVKAKQQSPAEILFVPTMLHQTYVNMVKTRRIKAIMDKLVKVFELAPIEQLRHLAENNCTFRQYKMHNYIYRAGSIPKNCYLVINGNVKVDSPGFEVKKMMEMVIVGENTIFGQNDLNQEFRLQNALCCSAQCQVLQIEKESYNKLISRNPKLNPVYAEKIKQLQRSKSKSTIELYAKKFHLPRIQRFHSHVRPDQEDKIEKQLVQNCHMLINISPKKLSKSGFRLPENSQRDYSVNSFDRKLVMFQRRKSSFGRIDLSNKLF